jgi:hypothetical protein
LIKPLMRKSRGHCQHCATMAPTTLGVKLIKGQSSGFSIGAEERT